MDTATIINITLCILSFVLAAVSVITVIITLRQNHKMIKNSTRPYVSIYFDYTQSGTPIGYFVIKNFGSSVAIIDALQYNDVVKNAPTNYSNIASILDGLIGNSIAPGQKFLAPFKLNEYGDEISLFDISYHSGTDTYSDHFEIAVKKLGKLVKPRLASNEYKAISYPLQEISERLM